MIQFLLIFVLLAVVIVFAFGYSILRLLLGGILSVFFPKKKSATNKQNQQPASPTPTKKIIDSDEGEYVEYEEIIAP
jgi:cell division protein FtsI/penicillin-binding protein 2